MKEIDGLSEAQESLIKDIMQSHGFTELKQTQRLAFEDGILENDNHLLVADTGNGKTLCAETIIKREIDDGGRVAYLVPSRQLVRDKKSSINEWCDKSVMTGSRKYSQGDVIVATFESFYEAILKGFGDVTTFDKIVLDDFHEIYSSYRGPDIEKAISAALYEDMDIFAMSATVGNPHEIAEWINGECTISPEGREISIQEEAVEIGKTSKKEAVADFIEENKQNAPFLVFNYAKSWTASRAQEVADRGVFRDSNDRNYLSEMGEKVDGELSDSLEELAQLMSQGVAYHHSNLPPQIKKWIEELYHKGEIKCIFATTTIAYGFDSPVKTVLVADIKRQGNWVGVWEYVQWIGRAARPGYGYDKGYAYTLTKDVDGTIDRYFSENRDLEAVETHIERGPLLRKMFLELVGTGWDTPQTIEDFISNTLFWQQLSDEGDGAWGRNFGTREERVEKNLRAAATWLEEQNFISESRAHTSFSTTEFGEASVSFLFNTFGSYSLTQIKSFYDSLAKNQDISRMSYVRDVSDAFSESLGERSCSDALQSELESEGFGTDEYSITAALIHLYWVQNVPIDEIENICGVDATYLPNTCKRLATVMEASEVFFSPNSTSKPKWYNIYLTRVEKGVTVDQAPLVNEIHGFGRYKARQLDEYLESISEQQSLSDSSLWGKLNQLYKNAGDRTKFKDILHSNVRGVGTKTAEKISDMVIDEQVSEEYKKESEDRPSTSQPDLNEWM